MMRSYFFTRMHRRFVIKYFGSTRNLLLWLLAVCLTVYAVDTLLFRKEPAISHSKYGSTAGSEGEKSQAKQTNVKQLTQGTEAKPPGESPKLPPACGQQSECPAGKYSYQIRSGVERDGSPTVCFNGHIAFSPEKKNGKRGFNVMVVNVKTLAVEDVRQFDTYEDDSVLIRYLRLGIEDGHLILMASQDDATAHLSVMSKKWLRAFGSKLIDNLQFRDSFVMLGQRGLSVPGSAIEQHVVRAATKEYPDAAEVKGCIAIPLGELKPAEQLVNQQAPAAAAPAAGNQAAVPVGAASPDCGLAKTCLPDEFAVHLFSGKENVEGPRMCINGHYVFELNVNNAGRGVNVAVFDVNTMQVVKAVRFDTYQSSEESASFTKLLQSLPGNHLVIAVSHDDMQTQLSEQAQNALESVGSSYVKQISFRDAWAFIGRSQIHGFSPFEEIEFGGPDVWPAPVDKKFCVPKQFDGGSKKADVNTKKNSPKRVFCRKYDGYEDFCRGSRLDEKLTPATLTDADMKGNAIFDIPIVVIPGLSHLAALQQFEALLANPGIVPKMVTVMYDIKFEESGLLAEFFGFGKLQLESSTKYIYLIEKALEEAWKLFPQAKYVILLEEEVIPTTDFLHYMSQCLPVLDYDETLIGATAWNENGFVGTSTLPDIVYRGYTFPGLGFMLKKSFYTKEMQNKMATCCMKRSWYGWFEGELNIHEMIVPDVSRVSRRQFMGLTDNVNFIRAYFNAPRVTSRGTATSLGNIREISADKYDESLHKLIASSKPLLSSRASECFLGKTLGFDVPDSKNEVYAIYFEQDSTADENILSLLCRCFKLFYVVGYRTKGLHNGILRFSYRENHMFFVGSASQFYKHKPASHIPITKSQLLAAAKH